MSKKNRKKVYDDLVSAGEQAYHRLSESLKAEFGDPKAAKAEKPKAAAPLKKPEPKKQPEKAEEKKNDK